MTRSLLTALLASALVVAGPSAALATPDGGRHDHEGFYWRPLVLGYGYEAGFARDGDVSRRLHSGNFVAVPLLTMGGALREDLVLYGSLVSMQVSTARRSAAGTGGHRGPVAVDDVMQMFLCLGVERYFMPSNFFWGAEIGPSSFDLDAEGRKASHSWGVRAQTRVGHEWWLSDNWAMGLAAQFSYALVPDRWSDGTFLWHLVGGALVGTMTFQ